MSSGILYLYKCSVINTIKLIFRKPLKMFGLLFMVVYFTALPFMMKSMIVQFGLANPTGFVTMGSFVLVYLSLPPMLSYFKRKGVIFRQSDINLVFTTPLSPKRVLIYGMFKSAYMSFVFQLAIFVAAIFIFKISPLTVLLYSFTDMILSTVSSYSLATLMYASENISVKAKNMIKYSVYALLGIISGAILLSVYQNGLSVSSIQLVIKSPLFLLIPFIGWQISYMNLIILGPTMINVVASLLYILMAISLFYAAKKMKCSGDYYEDALSFATDYEVLIKRNNNGEALRFSSKKKAIHNTKSILQGNKAQVIFSRQLLTHRRQFKFFIRFFDIIHLGIGFLLLFIIHDEFNNMDPMIFFYTIMGISIYLSTFFAALNNWRKEFDNYSLYLIPASNMSKLFYATLFEHLTSLIRAVFIVLPLAIGTQMPIIITMLAIIVFVLMRAMIIYGGILFKDIVGNAIGQTLASLLTMVINMILSLIPMGLSLLMIVFLEVNSTLAFIFVVFYCLLINWFILLISANKLGHIEALI